MDAPAVHTSVGVPNLLSGDIAALPPQLPPPQACGMFTVSSKGVWFGDDPLKHSLPVLMLQIIMIFSSTKITHFLLKPLGQPRIVTDILGGLILGPSFLGRNSKIAENVFPSRIVSTFNTLAAIGVNISLFLVGVKTDASLLKKTEKNAFSTGLYCLFLPIFLVSSFSFIMTQIDPSYHNHRLLLFSVTATMCFSSFPVISSFLRELDLLNSDIGRLALSASLISDIFTWIMNDIWVSIVLVQREPTATFGRLLSSIIFVIFVAKIARPLVLKMAKRVPADNKIEEIYLIMIVLWLLSCAFLSELIGQHASVGSFILGVAIPDGPPLGDALIQKFDAIVTELMLPLFMMMAGWQTDVFDMFKSDTWWIVAATVILVYIGKVLGALSPSFYSQVPLRDSISLGVIMNSRGTVEILLLNHWKIYKFLDTRAYSMMIICVVVSAGLSTPLLKFLHKPSGRYISHKIRTIQHAKSDSNIKILACVYDEDNVPALINLLRSFHATIESPLKIFLLHLVNLVGRAAPLLIEHSPDPRLSNRFTPVHYLRSEHIIAAFKRLESDQITVESFTSISPFSTMHHDVCKLALDKKVNMVIAPFHEKDTAGFCHSDSTDRAIRAINCNILADSPCSTAILIDRGQLKQSIKRVAVLFFGGADDREALACAARMIDGSEISLATIIRLRPEDESSNVPEDNQLDDDFLNNFRVQYGDKESVRYMEEKVKDAEAVMRIIRAMENICDLLIVGNRKGEESPLMAGMEEWSERPELGIIGDIVASSDFKDKFSVFVVVQQQRKVAISFAERIQ